MDLIKREQAIQKKLEVDEKRKEFDRITEENRKLHHKEEEEKEEKRKMVI